MWDGEGQGATGDFNAVTQPPWGSVAPQTARIYDFLLGGKNYYKSDQKAAEQLLAAYPLARTVARANRAFMHRVVAYLAGEVGIRQFIDIGIGLPASPNLHEVAQQIAPECRVAYVDRDPIVLAHARALLTSHPKGRTGYLRADLREPERIMAAPEVTEIIDFRQPVALTLIALLHTIPEADQPYQIVARLMDALPAGSCLAVSQPTADFAPLTPESMAVGEAVAQVYDSSSIPMRTRSRAEFSRFFTGLELVEPGIQVVHRWRPDSGWQDLVPDQNVALYGAVARKPGRVARG